MKSTKTISKGVTLCDLVLTMASVFVLLAVLVPVIQDAQQAMRQDECADNMRQFAFALLDYHDANETFPPAHIISPFTSGTWEREPIPDGLEGAFWGWAFRCAPFFGFQDFYDVVDPNEWPWWSVFPPGHPNAGLAYVGQENILFSCPADPRHPIGNYTTSSSKSHQAALTSYLGVNGRNQFAEDVADGQDGVIYVNSSVSFGDITDGISNTLILGERPPTGNKNWGWGWAGAGGSPGTVFFGTADVVLGVHEWASVPTDPDPITEYFRPGKLESNVDRYHFWSFHKGGSNWAFADGSTRFLTYAVDSDVNETTEPGSPPTVLAQFATRAGGVGIGFGSD